MVDSRFEADQELKDALVQFEGEPVYWDLGLDYYYIRIQGLICIVLYEQILLFGIGVGFQ